MNLPWRTGSALVIRTDFTREAEWDAIQRAILEPHTEEGFTPSVELIDLWQRDGRTFRVVPSEMASVENNLSLANMDWKEFAEQVDPDGIFRGLDY